MRSERWKLLAKKKITGLWLRTWRRIRSRCGWAGGVPRRRRRHSASETLQRRSRPGVDFANQFRPKFTDENLIWSNLCLLLWPYFALKYDIIVDNTHNKFIYIPMLFLGGDLAKLSRRKLVRKVLGQNGVLWTLS
jgi:hypothetical protein